MNVFAARSYRGFVTIGVIWMGLCSQGVPPAHADSDTERALREVDRKWSEAAATKDVDKVVSFYAENAIVLPPNAVIAQTKDSVRAIWKELLDTPGLRISWMAQKVEVAKSGELGYVSGTYELQMNDPSGKPVNDRGKYLEVMKRQSDGSWKCVADTWNSDLPATLPPEKK